MQLASKLCFWRATSRRRIEEIIGFLNFASNFLHLGRLRLRLIILWVNAHTSPKTREILVTVSAELENLVKIWLNEDFLRSWVRITPLVPYQQLMTDASDQGRGGILLPQRVGGPWLPRILSLFKRGIISMNLLELRAVRLSI